MQEELNEFYGMDKQDTLKYRTNDLTNYIENIWTKLEKVEKNLIKDCYNVEERNNLLKLCDKLQNIKETLHEMVMETYKQR